MKGGHVHEDVGALLDGVAGGQEVEGVGQEAPLLATVNEPIVVDRRQPGRHRQQILEGPVQDCAEPTVIRASRLQKSESEMKE